MEFIFFFMEGKHRYLTALRTDLMKLASPYALFATISVRHLIHVMGKGVSPRIQQK